MKDSFSNRLNQALYLRNMKPVELSEKTGLHKSRISQYTNGVYEAKQEALYLIAKALNVNEAWLMGYDVPMERSRMIDPNSILKLKTERLPLLETEAENNRPVLAKEGLEIYQELNTKPIADFCLKMEGDSMINARICDGDTVFVKQETEVKDGEIAAVIINNQVTLKRVYRVENEIILLSENPAYKPLSYQNDEMKNVAIIGKAVAFQSNIA